MTGLAQKRISSKEKIGSLGNFDPQALWAPREMLKLF